MTTRTRSPQRCLGLISTAVGVVLTVIALLPAVLSTPPELSNPGTLRVAGANTANAVPPPAAPESVAPGTTAPKPRNEQRHESSVGEPQRLIVPALGIIADIVPVNLREDGRLAVPEDFSRAGWYTGGPRPGEPGPAVIVGHVDSRAGPAVFFHLSELTPGDHILVESTEGTVFTYITERVEQHLKEDFPTADVYGPTGQRVLRVITCGGIFDRINNSYQNNTIVFARMSDDSQSLAAVR